MGKSSPSVNFPICQPEENNAMAKDDEGHDEDGEQAKGQLSSNSDMEESRSCARLGSFHCSGDSNPVAEPYRVLCVPSQSGAAFECLQPQKYTISVLAALNMSGAKAVLVRTVAKRLGLAATAGAPRVGFASLDVDRVGRFLRDRRRNRRALYRQSLCVGQRPLQTRRLLAAGADDGYAVDGAPVHHSAAPRHELRQPVFYSSADRQAYRAPDWPARRVYAVSFQPSALSCQPERKIQ